VPEEARGRRALVTARRCRRSLALAELRIHARTFDDLQAARALLTPALQIRDRVPEPRPLLQGWLGASIAAPLAEDCAAQEACAGCAAPGCGVPRLIAAARAHVQRRPIGLGA
jgi:hypothetical protein